MLPASKKRRVDDSEKENFCTTSLPAPIEPIVRVDPAYPASAYGVYPSYAHNAVGIAPPPDSYDALLAQYTTLPPLQYEVPSGAAFSPAANLPSSYNIEESIKSLDQSNLAQITIEALASPYCRETLLHLVSKKCQQKAEAERRRQEAERVKVVTFQKQIDKVERLVNVKYYFIDRRVGNKAYDCWEDIMKIVNSIAHQADPSKSLGTRLNAFFALLAIGHCIADMEGNAAYEVKSHFHTEPDLENPMCDIAGSMTLDERKMAREVRNGEFFKEMMELSAIRQDGKAIFQDIPRVIQILQESGEKDISSED